MQIVLVVAVLVVAAAVLYVVATLGLRTRQSAAPLIDDAARDISGKIEDLRGQLKALAGELEEERDQTRAEEKKTQGLLDHADSRMSSIASRLLADLDKIRHLAEQIGARQGELSEDLRRLEEQVTELGESAGHPHEATPGNVTAGRSLAVAGQFYVERLQFSMIRVQPESFSRSERQFRIQIERAVGELPVPPLGDLDDASTIAARANHDEGFRERLGKAASDYVAAKWGDPAFAVVTERWVTQNTFPETAAAEVCNRIGNGLDTIVEKPLEEAATELRLSGLEAATAAGTGSALILQPVTGPLGEVTRFLEITGVVVGVATGLHPLALAAAKMLARDEFHDALARGLIQAARTVFDGPQGLAAGPQPGEPPTVPVPAHPVDEPAEPGPAPASPPSDTDTWWQVPPRP